MFNNDQFIKQFNELIVPIAHKAEFKNIPVELLERLEKKVTALRTVPQEAIITIQNRPMRDKDILVRASTLLSTGYILAHTGLISLAASSYPSIKDKLATVGAFGVLSCGIYTPFIRAMIHTENNPENPAIVSLELVDWINKEMIGFSLGTYCSLLLAEKYPKLALLPAAASSLYMAYIFGWTWQKNRQLKNNEIAQIQARSQNIKEAKYRYAYGVERFSLLDGIERRLQYLKQERQEQGPAGGQGTLFDTCSICCAEDDLDAQNPCGHSFHLNCLVPWLEKNNTCPNCRAPIAD